jgi:hypothetical protein
VVPTADGDECLLGTFCGVKPRQLKQDRVNPFANFQDIVTDDPAEKKTIFYKHTNQYKQ